MAAKRAQNAESATAEQTADQRALDQTSAGTYLAGREVANGATVAFVAMRLETDSFRDGTVKTVLVGRVGGTERKLVLSRRVLEVIRPYVARMGMVEGAQLTLYGVPTTRPDGTPCVGIAARIEQKVL